MSRVLKENAQETLAKFIAALGEGARGNMWTDENGFDEMSSGDIDWYRKMAARFLEQISEEAP